MTRMLKSSGSVSEFTLLSVSAVCFNVLCVLFALLFVNKFNTKYLYVYPHKMMLGSMFSKRLIWVEVERRGISRRWVGVEANIT